MRAARPIRATPMISGNANAISTKANSVLTSMAVTPLVKSVTESYKVGEFFHVKPASKELTIGRGIEQAVYHVSGMHRYCDSFCENLDFLSTVKVMNTCRIV